MRINSAKDLIVYQKAFELAMDIFHASKSWPKEEKYALVDQIRRSSRSVCANLREAWAKRRYRAHFINKLTDVDGENGETNTWIEFAFQCKYLDKNVYSGLVEKNIEIGKMIGSILNNPDSFIN